MVKVSYNLAVKKFTKFSKFSEFLSISVLATTLLKKLGKNKRFRDAEPGDLHKIAAEGQTMTSKRYERNRCTEISNPTGSCVSAGNNVHVRIFPLPAHRGNVFPTIKPMEKVLFFVLNNRSEI